ncbi:MAG: redoxin family protein [Myxococcota bacterium]
MIWWLFGAALAGDFPTSPNLQQTTWLMGAPVSIPQKGTAVVELWATWCGPCIEQMPHLNTIAREYDGRIQVAAVSDEKPMTIRTFWSNAGWAPAYSVGTDISGATSGRFQAIDGSSGIPRAFIIDDGAVVWSGHPATMDPILAAVVDDRWSVDRAAAVATLPEAAARYLRAVVTEDANNVTTPRAILLANGDLAPDLMNQMAWTMLTEVPAAQRDTPFALEASRIAIQIVPDSFAYLDTYALALFENDRISEAIAAQQRAVQQCNDQEVVCEELKQRLTRFQDALTR